MKHSLPYLTRSDLGKYALVVFENASSYFSMDQWNRQLLHTYCRQFGVGLLGFINELSEPYTFKYPKSNEFVSIRKVDDVKGVEIANESKILRISKPGLYWSFEGDLTNPDNQGNVFHSLEFSNSSLFRTLLYSYSSKGYSPMVVEDLAMADGVRRVFFGHSSLSFWLNRVLFLDCLSLLLSTLSKDAPSILPLQRYIQIDIDDIFVGTDGKRMLQSDIEELVAFQHRLQQKISPNFRLNLGYSGGYYLHGNDEEDEADKFFMEQAQQFSWFHHRYVYKFRFLCPSRRPLND